ncbi:Cleavage stimulation factor subunit 3 [Binucleata daphniae]
MSNIAETLFEQKDFHKLKLYFESNLKISCDIRLFKTYLKYINNVQSHVQSQQINLYEVYEFIFKRMRFHWDIYPFINQYINILNNDANVSESDKICKTRGLYHKFLSTPMLNFSQLWKDYENFENSLNRTTAKKIISDILPFYQKAFRLYSVYKDILNISKEYFQDRLTMDVFYNLMEVEERNIPDYDKNTLLERIDFIYSFYAEKYSNEEIYFCWSEYFSKQTKVVENQMQNNTNKYNNATVQDICRKGINAMPNNLFFICYASLTSKTNFFTETFANKTSNLIDELENNLESMQNEKSDLILINYLSFEYKTNGIDAFRSVFKRYIEKEIGPHVFVYVANIEYYTLQNKEIPFRIYMKALQKYTNSLFLQESFIDFLLKTNDLMNARAFFDKFTKTESVCKKMMEYEMMFGSIDKYRDLISIVPVKTDNIAEPQKVYKGKEKEYMSFKNSIQFYGLRFDQKSIIEDFLNKIREVEVNCLKFDNACVVQILQRLELAK